MAAPLPELPLASPVIRLPEPCLVVLVGAAGSGKSTLAGRLFRADEVLSSDGYRLRIAGDEADQTVTRLVFRLLHRDLERRLAARRTTVVDATNVTSFARRTLTRLAHRHGIPAVAVVLDLPPELVLARNATRTGRIVPEAAVRRQLRDLRRALRRDQLASEGFSDRHVVREAVDLDHLVVQR